MDTAGIVQRLHVPGLMILAAGAVVGYAGHRLAAAIFPKIGEKAKTAIRFAGLGIASIGALILLDVFG